MELLLLVGKFAVDHGYDAVKAITTACGTDEITVGMWEEQAAKWLEKIPAAYLAEAKARAKK